jgi:hypothetical protein
MSGRSCDGPHLNGSGTATQQGDGGLACGGARGQHIVDQCHVPALQRTPAARCHHEGAAQVAGTLFARQIGLVGGVQRSEQQVRASPQGQGTGDTACDLPGLVEAPLGQTLARQRNRQHQIHGLHEASLARRAYQPFRQGLRELHLAVEFEVDDQAVPGEGVINGADRTFERRGFTQAVAASIAPARQAQGATPTAQRWRSKAGDAGIADPPPGPAAADFARPRGGDVRHAGVR